MISPHHLADMVRKSWELDASRTQGARQHVRTRPNPERDR
jgi:hypothetical protein